MLGSTPTSSSSVSLAISERDKTWLTIWFKECPYVYFFVPYNLIEVPSVVPKEFLASQEYSVNFSLGLKLLMESEKDQRNLESKLCWSTTKSELLISISLRLSLSPPLTQYIIGIGWASMSHRSVTDDPDGKPISEFSTRMLGLTAKDHSLYETAWT